MKPDLKICLVSAAFHPYPSGVSEHVWHLARTLQQLGQEVEVLTTSFPGRTTVDEPFPVTRFGRAIRIPLNRSYATLPVGLRLPAQVRCFLAARRFDIVHCHGLFWPEISYWALRYSRATNVVSFLTAGFRTYTLGAGLFRWLFRGTLSRIHGLVPISHRAWQAFQAYVPGKPRIIPCGIDLDRFRPGLEPLPAPEPGRPTVLFLGRLDARKGLLVLLRAMPGILAEIPETRLVVVGQGPQQDRARHLAIKLDIQESVEFVGPVPRTRLPQYYAGCDVYCSPALGGETLGIVLLEAMASGAPVVASDIPGYDETVRQGVDGLLCRPGDPDALGRAVVRVLRDESLRKSLRENGPARVREYSWPTIGGRVLGYYRELLDSSNR